MNIYIIIVHYGKLAVTQKCIDSLTDHEERFEKIIIVNNDGSVVLSPSQFALLGKKLHIVNNKRNLGFAAGVNIGITYALSHTAEFIFLLNNDTIIEKNFLKNLLSILEAKKEIGIIGPAIAFHKGGRTIYDVGGQVNLVTGRTQHTEVAQITDLATRIVPYISGCCMVIRKEVFERIGYFDKQFFLYYEDVDFCLRAKNAGFLSAVLPSVTIYHELSKAAGNISAFSVYHQTKSGVIFGKKHCKIFLCNILFLCIQSCVFFIKKRGAGIAAFKGLKDGLVR